MRIGFTRRDCPMVINRNALWNAKPIVDMAFDKQEANGTSYGLSEAGYDLRLKQDIFFKPNDLNGRPIIYVDGEPIPGRFTIASAMEVFEMPNYLVGIGHDKSTWARQGVSLFNTVIEPGYKGGLTLEIVFHGHKEIHIPSGSGIIQIIFHELLNQASYEGKYQNQSTNPEPARF